MSAWMVRSPRFFRYAMYSVTACWARAAYSAGFPIAASGGSPALRDSSVASDDHARSNSRSMSVSVSRHV